MSVPLSTVCGLIRRDGGSGQARGCAVCVPPAYAIRPGQVWVAAQSQTPLLSLCFPMATALNKGMMATASEAQPFGLSTVPSHLFFLSLVQSPRLIALCVCVCACVCVCVCVWRCAVSLSLPGLASLAGFPCSSSRPRLLRFPPLPSSVPALRRHPSTPPHSCAIGAQAARAGRRGG